MRDSIMLYRSQCDALRHLPADQFKAALTAIWDYGMDDKEPEGDPITIAVVGMAKPLIDKNNRNFENGKRGGRKANRSETEDNRNEADDNRIEPNGNRIKPSDNRVVTECNPKEKGERRNIKEISPKGDTKKDVRHKYGEYNNVLLSDKDLEKLKEICPDDWKDRIDDLSFYMKQYHKTYSDHLATILNWKRRDDKKTAEKVEPVKKNSFTMINNRDFDWEGFGVAVDGA